MGPPTFRDIRVCVIHNKHVPGEIPDTITTLEKQLLSLFTLVRPAWGHHACNELGITPEPRDHEVILENGQYCLAQADILLFLPEHFVPATMQPRHPRFDSARVIILTHTELHDVETITATVGLIRDLVEELLMSTSFQRCRHAA